MKIKFKGRIKEVNCDAEGNIYITLNMYPEWARRITMLLRIYQNSVKQFTISSFSLKKKKRRRK